jgi:hypothetical protein
MTPTNTEEHCEAEQHAMNGGKKGVAQVKVRINGISAVAK